jgi:hypothetical protein
MKLTCIKLFAAWMRILLNSFIICLLIASQYLDQVLPVASGNATDTQDTDFCIFFCLTFWTVYCVTIYTHCDKLMKSVGVMAASVCYSWRSWWCDCTHFCDVISGFDRADMTVYLWSLIVELSLQSYRYVSSDNCRIISFWNNSVPFLQDVQSEA